MYNNIIIVGTGKAGYLHYLKYKKLDIKNIIFLDKNNKSKYIDSSLICLSIEEIIRKYKFKTNETIIDICTPCSQFKHLIDAFIEANFSTFIVEKPFVVEKNYFNDKQNIKCIMMENYKNSIITNKLISILKNNKSKIKKLKIEFSKNRIKDSFSKRGMSYGEAPTNFEVEMPHEIYLANHLISKGGKKYKEVILKNMKFGNKVIFNHGYGKIVYSQGETSVILESNLMYEYNKRFINIELENGTIINAAYLNYDNCFNLTSNGYIEIVKKDFNKKINFSYDDNMYESLKKYLNDLSSNKNIDKYKEEIIKFSEIMRYCIEKGKAGNRE